MANTINYVIPLGSQCFSAFFLKINNLKLTSYPFDWIFSNPLVIFQILNDNFKEFLNKDNYVIQNTDSDKNSHKLYVSDLSMFNHRNPMRDDDYNYYVRCIDRFYDVLKKDGKKLFFMVSLKNEINNELENLMYLKCKLDELCDDYIFVCIFQKKCGFQSREIYQDGNMIIVQIFTFEEADGVVFDNENDTLFFKSVIDELFVFDLK
jgi:hypothetical protein